MSRILIIAPHPDDEVLGCGGTMRRRVKSGDEVYLCIVTEAYTPEWTDDYLRKKTKEIVSAQKVLGTKKTFLLGFPTVKLDTISQKKLNDAIGEVVNGVNPTEVFIPHAGDINKDHRIVHEASLVALRPKPESTVNRILSYEVLSETEWGLIPFIPQVYENISSTLDTKLEAMREYSSELKKSPHPRSFGIIEALAKKRGSEVGMSAAEAFMLIRQIER